jgi:hypothetical protein
MAVSLALTGPVQGVSRPQRDHPAVDVSALEDLSASVERLVALARSIDFDRRGVVARGE